MNKINFFVFFFLAGLISADSTTGRQAKRPFTVGDDIALTHFGFDPAKAIRFSPDGKYFAVYTERGRLDLGRPEDSLLFYRSQNIEDFLKRPDGAQPPSPVWVVILSTDKEGPIINAWRWLADSSGVAFLERTDGGHQRLVLADLRKKMAVPLTSASEKIKAFDIRDPKHYVYTIADPAEGEKRQTERQAPAIVGTGRSLFELSFPDDPRFASFGSRSYLWAVVGGKRFEVKHDGAPLVPEGDLVMSPDGVSLVTELPVPEVPLSWETLYLPFASSSRHRIHAGHDGSVHQFVRINLQTGSIKALTEAPISNDAGWWAGGSPSWSSDGQDILLPGTFLSSKDHVQSRPCIAVVDLLSNTRTCVETLKGRDEETAGGEEGYHMVNDVRFAGGDKRRVVVSFWNLPDWSTGIIEYQHEADGTWHVAGQGKDLSEVEHNGFEITVDQGLNKPPKLVVTTKQATRMIWDPNPQLKNIELGQASVYTWKDKIGRDWRGGLFKPDDYKPGQRYPLVIQTHGFVESEFIPSGGFPTAFAARELAAAGIAVLQVSDEQFCATATPSEGHCAVSDYEAAAEQLVSEGLVDPEKIGIIGFSRTCFYVMETLTTSSLHVRAASITDGFMIDYFQYLLTEAGADEAKSIIGAAPFGEGLHQWLEGSPGFNLDKVSAPLLVVGGGPAGVLSMWEPYAGLRYLQKPVDLIMLNSDEHVLTNPTVRMASQGGSVDWFRFWLQDYEDPDPAKAEQYARWRELQKMQDENDKKTEPAAVN